MKIINPFDYWQTNWENARRFFETKGNTETLCKLKAKWYNDFMNIFKDIENNLKSSQKNDLKKDWRIKAIQKANSNKEVNNKTLEGLKEYRRGAKNE